MCLIDRISLGCLRNRSVLEDLYKCSSSAKFVCLYALEEPSCLIFGLIRHSIKNQSMWYMATEFWHPSRWHSQNLSLNASQCRRDTICSSVTKDCLERKFKFNYFFQIGQWLYQFHDRFCLRNFANQFVWWISKPSYPWRFGGNRYEYKIIG